MLGGGLPGGLYYLGTGLVTCESGKVGDDRVFVLNMLDIDGDESPEMMFETMPSMIERLQGDGSWKQVAFERTTAICTNISVRHGVKIASQVLPQRPAIFRWK